MVILKPLNSIACWVTIIFGKAKADRFVARLHSFNFNGNGNP